MPCIFGNVQTPYAIVLLGVGLLLSGCGDTGNEASSEPSAQQIARMLENVDPMVCVADEVQESVIGSIDRWAYDQLKQMGQALEFNSVSASDTNRDILEVTCSANILAAGRNHAVVWKVRPALDSGGFLVGTPNNENLRNAIWLEVRRRQEQAAEPSKQDILNNSSADASSIGLQDQNTRGGHIPRNCVGFFNDRESAMGLVVTSNPPRVQVDFTDASGTPPTLVSPTSSGFSFAGNGGLEGGEYRVECHTSHVTVIPPANSYLSGRREARRDTVNIYDAGVRDGWGQPPE